MRYRFLVDNTDSRAVFNRDAYVSYEYRELSQGKRKPEVQESLNKCPGLKSPFGSSRIYNQPCLLQ